MERCINPKLFFGFLKEAEDESKRSENPYGLSGGEMYLYQKVFLSFLSRKEVSIRQLDLDSFSQEDIGRICDLVSDTILPEQESIQKIYQTLCEAEPQTVPVQYL